MKPTDDIELPENFKTVITKMHTEIKDVVANGYGTQKKYNLPSFDHISYFEVGVTIYFNQDDIPKGDKSFYAESLNTLFKMTYGSDMDFVSFKIVSLIVPPVKSNEEKFAELFGRK
jgi:hypothetical protein